MRAIKKLSRSIATALFTVALGETFDWVQSVPAGERPRYSPQTRVSDESVVRTVEPWSRPDVFKPTHGWSEFTYRCDTRRETFHLSLPKADPRPWWIRFFFASNLPPAGHNGFPIHVDCVTRLPKA